MPLLQTPTKKLHYRDVPATETSQAAAALPFILIHGLGSSQNYYTAVTPVLTAAGHRCISLDTTGQGRSPYTYVEQSVASLAQDIVDAMDALDIPRALVAGHSMAGITVPQLAATFPDRVAGIVLLGPVVPSKDAGPTFQSRIEAVMARGMEAMGDTVPQNAVGNRATPLMLAFIRELLMGQDPAGYVSMCRVIVGAADAVPEYKKIKCPVLIIAGEEDKSAPLKGCEFLKGAMGGPCEMNVMKQIGHWMCVEDPKGVGDLMTAWSAKINA